MHSLRFAVISLILVLVACACQPAIPPAPQATVTPVQGESRTAVPVTPTPPRPAASSPAALAACPVSEQQLAMRSGQVPNWASLGIFACYQLSLTIDDPAAPFHGTENLTFANPTGVALNDIVLRTFPNSSSIYGGQMTVQSVTISGQPAKFELQLADNSALHITLDRPLQPDAAIQAQLVFTLSPPLDFASKNAYGIFNRSSDGNELTLADWYPILATWKDGSWQDTPVLLEGDAVTSDTALFQVTVTTPPNWKVAATGKQIQTSLQDGKNQVRFVSGPVRDFTVVTGPNLESHQAALNDILITQWGEPSTSAEWDQALAFAQASLDYYDRTFGPYPFNELDLVAVPMQDASGDEFPGLVLILDSEYKDATQKDFLQVVIAHEIAHQWWYSMVGNDVSIDPWQDEALATYSSLLYLQSISSPIYPSILSQYKKQVSSYDLDHPNQSITQPVSAFQGRGADYSMVVYKKGALFFDSLRSQMGDKAFFQGLKAYYSQNQYQLIGPQPLLAAFSSSCQCDLSQVEQQYGILASP
jgi:hypothetical protein